MLHFLFSFLVIYAIDAAQKHRREQISRMKQYSLLTLSPEIVDEHSRLLEFVAFDQHYVVELTRKMHWTPSTVRHSNVDPDVHQAVSSLNESCHFSGKVLNDADTSVVSASLCYGRGLRARITAFGETLIIKPSAYYLDFESDILGNHSLNGEVLVYRLSDFDKPMTILEEELNVPSFGKDDILMTAESDDDEQLRRRLYSSGNPAQTEVAVVIGPVRTRNYQDDYGANWYTNLYQDTADIMNAVDEIYAATNWNAYGRNSVGGFDSLRVVMSEIYVIYSFTGIHSGMAPTKRFSNCPLTVNEYDDSDDCAIYGNDWLGLVQQWISNNMDTANYDNVQVITDMRFNVYSKNGRRYRTLGWGSVGTVCRGSASSSVNSVVDAFGGNDHVVGTMAHELGHNFGLRHDGQAGPASHCCADCGLMGYGSNDDTFSTCSLDLMEEYFNGDGNFLQCLGRGWDGNVISNVDDGQSANPSPTASPVHAPTSTPISTNPNSAECLRVEMGYDSYDGTWLKIQAGHANHEAYSFINPQGATKYLYYKELTWSTNFVSKWTISESLGSGSYVNLICTQDYLYECTGNWKYPAGGNSWGLISDSITDYQCDPNDVVDNSCDSTYSRICVAGSGDSGSYDGYYDAAGCHNGQRVYEGAGGNALTFGLFLCFDDTQSGSSGDGQWTISGTQCQRGNIISQTVSSPNNGVLDPSYWLWKSAGSSYHNNYDDDMTVYDCSPGNNGAFNGDEDLQCLDDLEYGEEICVSTNHSLWSGDDTYRTFRIYESLCSNDEPIYHFVKYNHSKSLMLPSGEVLNAEIEATFYLHFEWVYPTVTDNETVGQWWLSKDEMNEYHRIAFCPLEDLMECTRNQWNVKVTSPGMDGTIYNLVDSVSSVMKGHCDTHFGDELDADDSDDSANVMELMGLVTVTVVVSVSCLVMLGLIGFCAWRRLKYLHYRRDELKTQQASLDAEECHAVKRVQDGDETNEISVDVDLDAVDL